MAEDRAEKTCCAQHRVSLITESVGLPLLSLADLNFSKCFLCSSIPSVPSPAPCLEEFFHEYSAAVFARSLRRSRAFCPGTPACRERSIIDKKEVGCGGDDDGGACRTDTNNDDCADDDEGQLPLHLLLSDSVLSHLPLADVIRARYVSKAWMSTINDVLHNPCSKVHPYIRRPCLMLLHPRSEKIGASAALSVFEFLNNAWLTKPILFPSKASYLVGASHGLFCFATDSPVWRDFFMHESKITLINNNIDFFVGNPLTETWTLLPRPPSTHRKGASKEEAVSYAFVAYLNPNSSHSLGFKLVKIQSQSFSNVYIYDSSTGRWGEDMFRGRNIQHTVFETPELLHCFDEYGILECSYNLLNCTLERRLLGWPEVNMDDWPYRLSFLIRCAERTFCVYKKRRGEFEQAFVGLIPCVLHKWPVGVFRLEDNATWELVSEMPTNLLKEAVEEGSDGTDFVIGSDQMHCIFFILKGSSKMLVFDVLSSKWDTLPGCAYVPSFYPYKLNVFCEPLI
ncbi:hypothetical protein GOP47_0009096 [Adiantum capillus-veneris]|uniref:F-box domain-containing protein n=1 Tax=Adiantum capillus-veneris TaxID=13818 RepID=A0A9D4V048_ADICA|nr:hypothetical protein GOP47_0009096 [Adiantum capillus-veneris]